MATFLNKLLVPLALRGCPSLQVLLRIRSHVGFVFGVAAGSPCQMRQELALFFRRF